uniref:NADH dehydrogenase subunit 2 n=1 Tax=Sosibia gibba TaxID=3026508 RepID=UPI0023D854EC|nr:NADH dehydrogenase subunit 2 [Sosibia gibba]WCS40805.1 NADH dehydrogenase subunit 2 [Sosibia gibba]
MNNKSTNMLFTSILLISVPISISSNSWFIVWMGMEINMMAFIPLIMEQKNMLAKEAALTYFLVQTIASMLMIMSFIIMSMKDINNINLGSILLMSSLMIKSGMSPFHFWMPKMMEGINWNKCFILMTWQKLIPLMMMSNIIKINLITLTAMILSIIVGAIGGLNQTSLRKMMAYSSISNNGWMMMAMLMSEHMWMMYLIMYTIMTYIMTSSMNSYMNFHINQIMSMNESTTKKLMIMMNMLSISGLPPMMGFMPKWLIIQTATNMNELMLMGTMIIMTLITVFYYLRIMFSVMMLSNIEPKWNNKMIIKNKSKMYLMSTITLTGLMLITMSIMLM